MIFSSLKNIVKDYVNKNNKKIYFDEFKKILNEQNICSELQNLLLKEFENNFNIMFVESTNDAKDIALGIMWITLFNYTESIISTNSMCYKRIVIFGRPGCGKTSLLCSLLKKIGIKKIIYYSDNYDSFHMLKNYTQDIEIIKHKDGVFYDGTEIYECNTINSLKEILLKYDRSRLFICLPINFDRFALNTLCSDLKDLIPKISGIFVSKFDFHKNITCCLNAAFLLKSKILMFSSHEIASSQRCVLESQTLSNKLLDVVFNKQHDLETIKMLFSNNSNAIDLQTYTIYLKFLMKFESINTDKLLDMFGVVAKKMNISADAIKQLSNENIQSETFEKFRKHIIIMSSMRRCERKYPWLIDFKRINRIALGSGVNTHDVVTLLNNFDKYKQAMKYMNYYKFLDNIK